MEAQELVSPTVFPLSFSEIVITTPKFLNTKERRQKSKRIGDHTKEDVRMGSRIYGCDGWIRIWIWDWSYQVSVSSTPHTTSEDSHPSYSPSFLRSQVLLMKSFRDQFSTGTDDTNHSNWVTPPQLASWVLSSFLLSPSSLLPDFHIENCKTHFPLFSSHTKFVFKRSILRSLWDVLEVQWWHHILQNTLEGNGPCFLEPDTFSHHSYPLSR